MRRFIAILGLYFVFAISGQSAMAVEPEFVEDLMSTPPVVEKDVQVAQALSPWMVEEFKRRNGMPTGECIMRADYNNNLEITFKGKKGQLSAVRVRDISGVQGSKVKGFLALGLDGNSYGLQSKSMQGQIDASLLTVPAPAEKIMDLDKYKLRIGVNDYFFSTDGFAMAYQDLLKCHGYENAQTIQVVSAPRAVPVILDDLVRPVAGPTGDSYGMPSEPVDLVAMSQLDSSLDMVDEDLSVRMETWTANKGDKLSTVLEAWAIQAGVKPEIELGRDVTLARDFKIFGPLDIAVNQVLNDTLGENASSASIKSRNGDVTQISELKIQPQKNEAVERLQPPQDRIKWRALQGTDLKKVLQRWSAKENVDFIWDADQTFLVKKTMREMTDYNGAVASLLRQYLDQNVKPKGSLNIDPNTGRKTLVVTAGQSS